MFKINIYCTRAQYNKEHLERILKDHGYSNITINAVGYDITVPKPSKIDLNTGTTLTIPKL